VKLTNANVTIAFRSLSNTNWFSTIEAKLAGKTVTAKLNVVFKFFFILPCAGKLSPTNKSVRN